MSILTHPAFGPRASLIYITFGVLLDVWTAVWYFAFVHGQPASEGVTEAMSNQTWFWLVGLFLTGVSFVIIGLLLGHIGQAARRAEMPPQEAARTEANIQQTAAANPPPANLLPAAAGPQPAPAAPAAAVPSLR